LLLLFTVGVTVVTAWSAITLFSLLHPWLGWLAAVFLAWSTLAPRSLHAESAIVAEALQRGDLPEARRLLARIVGRDTAHLEEREIWRALVETVAENSSDGVVAPLFYLMLGGPVLALAYKAVNTLDSTVGYKTERYLCFGWASARFDDLVNWLPARLTGLLMVLASPLLGLSASGAWRVMRRDGRNHSSPNSGIPEASAAGALGVQLGGDNRYFGQVVAKPTIGDPLSPLSYRSYQGVVWLMYGALAIMMLIWLGVLLSADGVHCLLWRL
jgi:adenosylcobinamide-phosphate synthase